jgi:hypothetical protein
MAIFVGEWRRIGRVGTFGLWPCVLITRRSQVQILPPGLKPSGCTSDLADRSMKCHLPVVGESGKDSGIVLCSSSQVRGH